MTALKPSKRGRPKKNGDRVIQYPMDPKVKVYYCTICKHRQFPRRKSLQAHLRIHENKRPFMCNYPRCESKFRQSGHLRIHEYIHTGEKPFACSYPGCTQRYTHSNRKCKLHKEARLERDGKSRIIRDIELLSEEEKGWFRSYKSKRENEEQKKQVKNISNQENIPVNGMNSNFSSASSDSFNFCSGSDSSNQENIPVNSMKNSLISGGSNFHNLSFGSDSNNSADSSYHIKSEDSSDIEFPSSSPIATKESQSFSPGSSIYYLRLESSPSNTEFQSHSSTSNSSITATTACSDKRELAAYALLDLKHS